MEKWRKHIPYYVLELIILIGMIFALCVVNKATKMQKVNLDKDKIKVNEMATAGENGSEGNLNSDGSTDLTGTGDSDWSGDFDDGTFIADNSKEKPEEDLVDTKALEKELSDKYNGKFTMAFFGVDSRDRQLGAGTRSDSIMVCDVDLNLHKIKLVSIYRDTYLNVGDDYYDKCNAAYGAGGPERALSMINTNLDLYVTDYITVGFQGLIDSIDALGGIPVEVTEDEIFHLNNYQMCMAEELDVPYTPVVYPGMQMLNGLQATAYCRIRYGTGSDFRRAERQRSVIEAMLKRSKNVSVSSLTNALSAILPNVQTSLDVKDLVSMMRLAGNYEIAVSEGFPFKDKLNGANLKPGQCVIPTSLEANVIELHKLLYGENNYEPSSTVKEYSKHIENATKGSLLW